MSKKLLIEKVNVLHYFFLPTLNVYLFIKTHAHLLLFVL